ncbi:glycerophosphoryl diester phosphodiesterase membrane domain-containing protein [Sphingobium sp. CR2-8]|uniref:glycerophosphoryl diester phosphodiesterase membrane domain-containing protein n=1 Tax=Sphingobium sp. CR2-8 TaxID=1306534 RepID=UPI002DBA757B|nr:glycerophosphoryl diester phosphodiesterase membrane domain-containing protein [Sphingobium sp. CR2-8]MEC3911222.1 glycerophosphoryl diester phosphodiesterase membrane domain-containing protein [Sphingobium sp. CR2-8]
MNETARRIEIGGIFSAALGDIGRDIARYGGFAVVIGVLGGLTDTYLPQAGNMASNIALFFLSVLAVYHTLRTRLGAVEISPRFGAAFGFSLVSGLAMALGFVLLIVPGVLLFVRWAVGLPALLRENLGITEAMRRSSVLTQGNRWRILGLGLLIWVPFLIVMVAIGGLSAAFAGEASLDSLLFNILVNLAAGGASILSSVCWTEAYLTLSREDESGRSLAEIFA